jgi:AAA15 family ATPase/GTPase
MLKSLELENFRGFQSFALQQLGRVNLLVGTNNSGKTSILEAIQLLCSHTAIEPLIETMTDRGENREHELDICHLFHTHSMELGSKLVISGLQDNVPEKLTLALRTYRPDGQPESSDNYSLSDTGELELVIQWMRGQKGQQLNIQNRFLQLSINSGLPITSVRRLSRETSKEHINIQFITPSSLTQKKMVELFEQVVLTPEEAFVNQALQTIEPMIERIASIGSDQQYGGSGYSRRGFVVKRSGISQRVPIGSMGDGMWRMLGLALSVVSAKGGVLLVDDIDTGLHFTVMSNMWKLIWETAKRLDVQVFATTHSSDCWTSLSEIAKSEDASEQGITIHRIERDKSTSVVFDERKIVVAANRDIEVR